VHTSNEGGSKTSPATAISANSILESEPHCFTLYGLHAPALKRIAVGTAILS
jgi:hypothetical protein